MKKILISCIAALPLLFAASEARAEAIIKGHIRNVAKGAVHIQYKEAVLNNLVYFKTELVGDSFEVRLDLLDPVEVQVWIEQEHFTLFTLPDDLTIVDGDANDISGSISFKGTHTADNDFLLAIDKLKDAALKGGMQKGPEEQEAYLLWRKQLNESNQHKMDALFATAKDYKLSAAYRKNAIDGLAYRKAATALFGYVMSHASIKGMTFAGGQSMSKEGVDSMIAALKIENPDLLLNLDYMHFLDTYKNYIEQLEDAKLDPGELANRSAEAFMKVKFALLEQRFKNEDVRYALLVNDLGASSGVMESALFTQWAGYVIAKYPGKRHNEQLRNMIAGKQVLLPGGPAPMFELEDNDGKKVALSQLKGKVVYVDFWGSWCIPCVYENRVSKTVKKDYKDKDVVFVYITRDEDKTSWKDAIARQELTGLHLFAGKSTVFYDYQADGVPHYVLIGKDGKIITSSAPRPSDTKALYSLLDKALE